MKCHEIKTLNNQKSDVNVQSNNFNGKLYSAYDTSTKSNLKKFGGKIEEEKNDACVGGNPTQDMFK